MIKNLVKGVIAYKVLSHLASRGRQRSLSRTTTPSIPTPTTID